jgi:adhesin/invasin
VVPGSSTVELAVQGQVRDANGDLKMAPVEGGWVTLKLSPQSGSPASGAKLQYSTDAGVTWSDAGDTYEARIGADGGSLYQVRVLGASAGGYNLTAQIGSDYLKNKETGVATNTSPVQIWFDDASAEVDNSFVRITATADQKANRLAPNTTAADWGKQTITVTLQNSAGQPYKNGESELRATSPLQTQGGLYYATADSNSQGLFTCAEGLQSGRCESGTYTLVVYAAKSGNHNITVTYTPKGGTDTANAWVVLEGNSNNTPNPSGASFVTATFVDPPASGSDSVLIFSGYGESDPMDVLSPEDEPDGKGVVHDTGYSFKPAVRVWDAGRNNPLAGKTVEFQVPSTCVGSFENGQKTQQVDTGSDGVTPLVALTSTKAGTCPVTASVLVDSTWVAVNDGKSLNGEGKIARWKDPRVDLSKASFTVQAEPVVANGTDTGSLWVTLIGETGHPVTTYDDAIHATGPDGKQITFTTFTLMTGADGDAGRYVATFKGTDAGDHLVTVTVTEAGDDFSVNKQTGGNDRARLKADIPDATNSTFIFKTVDPDDPETLPADDPAGSVIARKTGGVFHPQVNVADYYGNDVQNAQVRFRIPTTCAAQFGQTTTTADGYKIAAQLSSASGAAQVTISSTVEETCRVYAEVQINGTWTAVGSYKEAVWQDPDIDYSTSYYSVSEADVVADGDSDLNYGIITVYLQGESGYPLTTAALSIGASADNPASLLQFSAFTHTAVDGVYTAKFWGVKAGDWDISVEAAEEPVNVKKNQSGQALNKQAHMVVPPASANDSILIFNSADQSNPFNNWDLTTVVPNGKGIPLKTGQSYDPAVRVWDVGRYNAIPDVYVRFTVPSDCVGTFQNSQRTYVTRTNPEGKATTQLTAYTVGSCQVTAEIADSNTGPWSPVPGGSNADGGYAKVATWQDPDVDLSKSYFRVSDANVEVSEGDKTGTVTVTLIGTTGYPVTTAKASLAAAGPAGVDISFDEFSDAGSGVYTASFWGTEAGEHPVTVKWNEASLAVETQAGVSLNNLAHLVHAPVNPAATVASLHVDSAAASADGSASVAAWMVVQDVYGNPISGATGCLFSLPGQDTTDVVWFGLITSRANPASVTTPTGSDGKCSVQIRALESDRYPVKGHYSNATSPAPDPVATFNSVPIDPGNSWWSVARNTGNTDLQYARADGKDSYIVTVNARGENNEIANLQSVTVYWQLDPGGTVQHEDIMTGVGADPGVAVFNITAEVAGDYKVWVKSADNSIATLPGGTVLEQSVRFRNGPADEGTSEFTHSTGAVLPLDNLANVHWARVIVKDAKGNLVPNSTVYFTLESTKQAHFIRDNGSGTAEDLGKAVSITTSLLGVAEVLIAAPNQPAPTTTSLLTVRLGGSAAPAWKTAQFLFSDDGVPDPEFSSFVITPNPLSNTMPADGEATSAFVGTITYRTSNDVPVANRTVEISTDNSSLNWTGDTTSNSAGVAKVYFTSTVARTYTVNAKIGNASIPTVDQRLTFTHLEPSTAQSSLSVTTTPTFADGTSAHSAWVIVKDSNNNPVPGATVDFKIAQGSLAVSGPSLGSTGATASVTSCDPSATAPPAPSWCDEPGKAQVTITSLEPGTFAVDAAFDASFTALVKDTGKTVTFTAGDPDASSSSRTVSPNTDLNQELKATADGTDGFSVEAEIRSLRNLLVDGAAVRLRPISANSADLTITPVKTPELTGSPTSTPPPAWGKFSWTATSLTAGTYLAQVDVQIRGAWTEVGDPVRFNFEGDKWDASASWLVQPDGNALANGVARQLVKVHALDANGNEATSGQVKFAVPADITAVVGSTETPGGSTGTEVTVDVSDGIAQVAYKTTTVGVFVITAQGVSVVKDATEQTPVRSNGEVHLTFLNTPPSPGNSTLTIPTAAGGATKKVGAADDPDAEKHMAQVVVRDETSNLVQNGLAKVVFTGQYTDLSGVSQTQESSEIPTNDQGVAQWEFSSEVATTWTVTARVVGTNSNVTPSAGLQARFVPDDPDPAHTTLHVSQETAKANGIAAVDAWMVVRDRFDNPVPGVQASCVFTVSHSDPAVVDTNVVWFGLSTAPQNPVTVSGLTDAQGRCTTQIRSYTPGQYPVTAAYRDKTLPAADQPAQYAAFSNLLIDPQASSWTVQPKQGNVDSPARADGNDGYLVTVLTRAANDDIVNLESVTVYWQLTAGGQVYSDLVRSGEDGNPAGTATYVIKSTQAGDYNVWVQSADVKIPTVARGDVYMDQVTFKHGPADPTETAKTFTYSTGSVLPLNDLDHTHYAQVTVVDKYGNAVPDVEVYFALDSAQPAHLIARPSGENLGKGPYRWITSESGIARVELTAAAPPPTSQTTLTVTLNSPAPTGAEVGKTTFDFSDSGGPEPTKSSFVITPSPLTNTRVADGDDYFTGTVTIMTANNVPVQDYTVSFEHESDLVVEGNGVTNAAGQATVLFKSEKAKTYTVNAKIGAASVPVADQKLTFVPDDPTPGASYLTVTDGKAAADGAAAHKATVTVLDSKGNAVSGKRVYFSVTDVAADVAGPSLSASSAVSEDGKASVTITSEEPGTFYVSAFLDAAMTEANKVSGSPKQISFEAGTPDPSKSSRTVVPNTDGLAGAGVSVTANGSSQYAVTVEVRSSADLLVDNAPVRLVLTSANGADLEIVEGAGPVNTYAPSDGKDKYGRFTWHARTTVAATYTAQVEVLIDTTWESVGEPVTLRFKPDEISATDSWLVQPDGSAVANNDATLLVRAHARDAKGNDATSGDVVLTVPAGLTAVVGGVPTVGGSNVTVTVPVVAGYADVRYRASAPNHAGLPHYVVTATSSGTKIAAVRAVDSADSPVLRTDGEVRLVYTNAGLSSGNSELSIPTAEGGATKQVGRVQLHRAEVLVKDDSGNPVRDGLAEVLFTGTYIGLDGLEKTENFRQATNSSGVATWEFGSLVATTWTITARLEGTQVDVSGSPQYATFTPRPLNVTATLGSLYVDQVAKMPDNKASVPVTMKAQDEYGNPLSGIQLGFELTYEGADGPKFGDADTGSKVEPPAPSGPDGLVSTEIKSRWDGDYPVVGTYLAQRSQAQYAHFSAVGPHADHSDFTVVAKPGNADAPKARADNSDAYVVTVTLRDEKDVLANNASADIWLTPQGIAGAQEQHVGVLTGSDGPGLAKYEFKTDKAGVWRVVVKIGGVPIAYADTDPAELHKDIEFVAGPVVDGRLVSPTSPAEANGLQEQVVKAYLWDAKNNPAPGQPVTFQVPSNTVAKLPGGSQLAGPATVDLATGDGSGDTEKGVARLVLVSEKVGAPYVSATAGQLVLTEGGSAAQVRFVNTTLSVSGSQFTIPSALGTPSTRPVTGYHNPTVVLYDAKGNAYVKESVEVTFQYRLQGAETWLPGATVPTSTSNGTAVWAEFRPANYQAGVYEVRASISAGQVPNAQTVRLAEFVAGPVDPDPSHTLFEYSTGKVLPNDDDTHWVLVTVRDSYDNLVKTGVEVAFTLTSGQAHFVAPNAGLSAKVTATAGLALVEVSSPVNATPRLTATIGDAEVGRVDLRFADDGAVAGNSTWSVSPASPATKIADGSLAESFEARVLTRDKNNLVAPDSQVSFVFNRPGVAVVEPADKWVSDASGVLVVHFVSEQAGVYVANAQIAGQNVPVANQQIEFVAGPISSDPDKTFLTKPDSTAVANGQDELKVTATVLDAKGNAVKDAWVTFTVAPTGTVAVGPTESQVDANGNAYLTLRSEVADSYSVTAQAKKGSSGAYSDIVGGSPAPVVFTPGPVDPAVSVITSSPSGPLDADGLTAYTVTVELKDAKGNAVKQANLPVAIEFQLFNPDGSVNQGAAAETRSLATNADGVATVQWPSTKAGTWKATARVGQAEISGSPQLLTFEPLEALAGSSSFRASSGNQLANGILYHEAFVVAKDQNGNPVSGVPVEFGVEPGAAGVTGPTLVDGATVETCDYWAGPALRPEWCTEHGLAWVKITSEEPGSFDVWAEIGDSRVAGSPLKVTFVPGAVDPSRSSYTLDPDTAVNVSAAVTADGEDVYTVTLTVRSTSNILVPAAAVRLDGLDPKVTAWPRVNGTTGPTDSDQYGVFQWQLTAVDDGTYTGTRVQVQTASGWADVGGPLTLNFKAGDPVGSTSHLVQPAVGLADGETPSVVRARLFDAQGNSAQTGTVRFHIPLGLTAKIGGVAQAGPVDVDVPVAAGVAEVPLTTSDYGSYIVTAGILKADGTEDSISTVLNTTEQTTLFTDGSVPVLFNAGDLSALDSTLEITTAHLVKLVGGADTHTAEVRLKDSTKNPVAATPVTVQWALGDAFGPTETPSLNPFAFRAAANGTVEWNTVTGFVSDADGVVTFDFSSPQDADGNHLATWVWVRAHALPAGADPLSGWIGVGEAEVNPPHEQALKGAEFTAGPIDPDKTAATFETWTEPVLNNLIDASWARVVVTDQHGNGIGGVNVTFKLPTSQTGADGTPVFVDGATPPASKTITVTSCAYDLSPVPDECKIDGVYTPGLAYVEIVSDYEGTFTVNGSVDGGALGAINVGSGPVTFDAGAGKASASWFTLDKTDASAAVVLADGVASYTLIATVMNGEQGASLKPVSGECVTPQLPAGVSVKSGAQGTCPAGSYVTDSAGQATIEVVSTVSGIAQIGVNLGASRIPTEAEGTVYLRDALFVGGPPSYVTSELISPSAPVRADDPAGQTVTVAVKDEFGNPASCWADGVQVPCDVVIYVPVGTWVGSGAALVNGPAWVEAYTNLVDYSASGPGAGAGQASVTYFGIEGIFSVTARVAGVDVQTADGVRAPDDSPASARVQFTDATAPGQPVVNPSDGGHVSGNVGEEDLEDAADSELVVVIVDENGTETRCPVKVDGSFDCPIVPKLPDGTELVVVIEDKDGNQTDPPIRIETDGIAPSEPVVDPSQGGSITGTVDPEDVTDAGGDGLWVVVTDPDNGDEELCRAVVLPDGSFRCDFEIPLEDGKKIDVKIEDPAGNQSDGGRIEIDATAPGPPTPKPSDGETMTGIGDEAGNTIVVADEDGNVLCEAVVQGDLSWECELEPQAKVGDTLTITEQDKAGNAISKPWRVGIPAITIAKPTLCTGEQAATAINFQPGEAVTALTTGDKQVGSVTADKDGQVVVKWVIAQGTAQNKYTLTLRGAESGDHMANFSVVCPPEDKLVYTGADGIVGLLGSALGLLIAGFLLLLAAKRRRQEDEAAVTA